MILITGTLLMLLNLILAFWQLELKNYKTAIFCGFASGFCAFATLIEILK